MTYTTNVTYAAILKRLEDTRSARQEQGFTLTEKHIVDLITESVIPSLRTGNFEDRVKPHEIDGLNVSYMRHGIRLQSVVRLCRLVFGGGCVATAYNKKLKKVDAWLSPKFHGFPASPVHGFFRPNYVLALDGFRLSPRGGRTVSGSVELYYLCLMVYTAFMREFRPFFQETLCLERALKSIDVLMRNYRKPTVKKMVSFVDAAFNPECVDFIDKHMEWKRANPAFIFNTEWVIDKGGKPTFKEFIRLPSAHKRFVEDLYLVDTYFPKKGYDFTKAFMAGQIYHSKKEFFNRYF